jgi:hypothetical protein
MWAAASISSTQIVCVATGANLNANSNKHDLAESHLMKPNFLMDVATHKSMAILLSKQEVTTGMPTSIKN